VWREETFWGGSYPFEGGRRERGCSSILKERSGRVEIARVPTPFREKSIRALQRAGTKGSGGTELTLFYEETQGGGRRHFDLNLERSAGGEGRRVAELTPDRLARKIQTTSGGFAP